MNQQEEQLALLRAMLSEHQKTLEEALAVVRRERPVVTSLEDAVAALSGKTEFLQAEAQATSARLRFLSPSQPDPNVPARKAEYAAITIIASLQAALKKQSAEFVHVDELVREIYEPIPHRDVFYRIKRTLVSELLRGMDKNFFVRGPKPNTFGLKQSVPEPPPEGEESE